MEYYKDFVKETFLAKTFAIAAIILSIVTIAITRVTFGQLIVVVGLTVLLGLVSFDEADKLFIGKGGLFFALIALSLVTGSFISGLLLTVIYFVTYTATRLNVCVALDRKIIAKYESQNRNRYKKYKGGYRKRRRNKQLPHK